MFQAIARRVVRMYPPAWRRRYEAELLALIDADAVTLSQLADLVRSSVGEWWRAGATSGPVTRTVRIVLRGVYRLAWVAGGAAAIVAAGVLVASLLPDVDSLELRWKLDLTARLGQMAIAMRLSLPTLLRRRSPRLRPPEIWTWTAVMVACSAVTWLIRGEALDAFMFPFVFVSLLRQPVVRDESLDDARERLASAEAALAASRRVLWHLDDYRTLGLVRDDEFELVLRDERDTLESVLRERATIARLRSW